MKNLILPLTVSLILTSPVLAVPLGTYKSVDFYCTDPKYVYTPEEKIYRENLNRTAPCGTGKIQDFLCYDDYYTFGPNGTAEFITVATEKPGVYCIERTQATYTEKKPGFIEALLGEVVSEPHSDDPNVEIKCGQEAGDWDDEENGGAGREDPEPPKDPSPQIANIHYRMQGENMIWIYSGNELCPAYNLKLVPTKAP